MKTSAGRTLARADAMYLSTIDDADGAMARARFEQWRAGLTIDLKLTGLPIFTRQDIPQLIQRIQESAERLCVESKAPSPLRSADALQK
jgi:hypothetical protein